MKKYSFAFLLTFVAFACFINIGNAQINLGFSINLIPEATVSEPPPQPSDNHVWIESQWVWQNDHWAEQPGYWTIPERDHIWIRGEWIKRSDGSAFWVVGFWKPIPHVGVSAWLPEPNLIRPPQPSARHVWVTGEWRWQNNTYAYQPGYWAIPEHHKFFVKGHWAQWPNGEWYWANGYWKSIPENVFVKAVPPEPNFSRPPAPSPQHVWIDGEWIWKNSTFTWQPGYWMVRNPHRIWIRGYWHQREDGGFYWVGGHFNWV